MNETAQPTERKLAVFDFDHTLVTGDSFFPFLGFVCGWPQTIKALAESVGLYLLRRLKDKNDPTIADHRTFIKAELMLRTLKGKSTADIKPAVEKLYRWQTFKPEMKQALLDHHAQGHHVVVASGGLDLYLPELLKDLSPHGLICTQIEVRNTIITAAMLTGNCVRKRKAELVADYIAKNGPFGESWGYGNYPHDVPMLELMKHRILV